MIFLVTSGRRGLQCPQLRADKRNGTFQQQVPLVSPTLPWKSWFKADFPCRAEESASTLVGLRSSEAKDILLIC